MSDVKRQMEPHSAVYKTLLESTKAIPWKIDWATQRFAYVGPQIEALLGWSPESWATLEDWVARMHPDDRQRVVNYCTSQSLHGVDHEADYRALTRAGDYVWIRDVVHVVREHGEVQALIGFMFDISERKRDEERLLELQRELEALSLCDELTGIANRRQLMRTLAREWASAMRTGQPISVILADVDCFKGYNDCYGHLAGDECLRQVTTLLKQCALRPRDLLARYGGDEFVLVLPETDRAAAGDVAERCRMALLDADVPHAGCAPGFRLSLSLGVVSMIPLADDTVDAFIDAVDKAMYRAKEAGRNRLSA